MAKGMHVAPTDAAPDLVEDGVGAGAGVGTGRTLMASFMPLQHWPRPQMK